MHKITKKAPAKNTTKKPAAKLRYVVLRCLHSGVFAGFLERRSGSEVTMRQCRRCWEYDGVGGTGSCTDLALSGPGHAPATRISAPMPEHELLDVLEVLYVSADVQQKFIEIQAS